MVALPQLVDPIIGSIPAYGTIMAGCVLSLLPLIGVFLLFRRTILSSVVIGAVK
jgi:ABC-type glycerol-3-phosphate transport system permease component